MLESKVLSRISYLSYFKDLKCGGCIDTFYGMTKRHFKVQICEHSDVLHLIGKKDKD